MDFAKVELNTLLGELVELQSDWMDAKAVDVLAQIKEVVPALRKLGRAPTAQELEDCLTHSAAFIDVCRLFLGISQESAAHQISAHLSTRLAWTRIRSLGRSDPSRLAAALVKVGLPDILHQEISKVWTSEDVLIDRYRMLRGRAMAGQARGRSLERQVETILKNVVPFEPRVTFVGREGRKAKCDIAIPTRDHPKIVIEAKGFEATGSKLTDFLGDIGKIIEAKESRMYFFIVTDGRGWLNRKSDLQHVVDRQHQQYVDMIFTSTRLDELAKAVTHIWQHERSLPT